MADELSRVRSLYLDAMERILCNSIYDDEDIEPRDGPAPYDAAKQDEGRGWPARAHTMIGRRRLAQLRQAVEQVLLDHIPGDLIEAGVWRGGASIMMRAVLAAFGDVTRQVWVADSFRGLPPPSPERYPHDSGLHLEGFSELAIPVEVVQSNFEKHDLLDDQVHFVQGWFSETLQQIPAREFAVIRLDGDLYESTMDALKALYPRLASGGFAIIDDYGALDACSAAVRDYRAAHAIDAAIHQIDWTGAFWRKP